MLFKCTSKFIKDNKITQPVGQVEFVVFDKIIRTYLNQTVQGIMLSLISNLHEESLTDNIDGSLFVICSCVKTFLQLC